MIENILRNCLTGECQQRNKSRGEMLFFLINDPIYIYTSLFTQSVATKQKKVSIDFFHFQAVFLFANLFTL